MRTRESVAPEGCNKATIWSRGSVPQTGAKRGLYGTENVILIGEDDAEALTNAFGLGAGLTVWLHG